MASVTTDTLQTVLQQELDEARRSLQGVDHSLSKLLGRPSSAANFRGRGGGGRVTRRNDDDVTMEDVHDDSAAAATSPPPLPALSRRWRDYEVTPAHRHFTDRHTDSGSVRGGGEGGGGGFRRSRIQWPGSHHEVSRGDRTSNTAAAAGGGGGGDYVSDEPHVKRRALSRHEITRPANFTITVPRPARRSLTPDDTDGKCGVKSHVVAPSEVSADDSRSRQVALQQHKTDKENINRSRRVFGALLGTLQKFRSDEMKLKDKEEKRAVVERRLDENARQERLQLRQQKSTMLATRRRKQQQLKLIEMKAAKVREEREWENHQNLLMNFARTECKPYVCFLPKLAHPATDVMLQKTRQHIADDIAVQRQRLGEELALLDSRLSRLHQLDNNNNNSDDDDEDNNNNNSDDGDEYNNKNNNKHDKNDNDYCRDGDGDGGEENNNNNNCSSDDDDDDGGGGTNNKNNSRSNNNRTSSRRGGDNNSNNNKNNSASDDVVETTQQQKQQPEDLQRTAERAEEGEVIQSEEEGDGCYQERDATKTASSASSASASRKDKASRSSPSDVDEDADKEANTHRSDDNFYYDKCGNNRKSSSRNRRLRQASGDQNTAINTEQQQQHQQQQQQQQQQHRRDKHKPAVRRRRDLDADDNSNNNNNSNETIGE